MNQHLIKSPLLVAATALLASAVALAAEPAAKPEGNVAGRADMHHGMMGKAEGDGSMMDMMEMMEMMSTMHPCQSRMGSGGIPGEVVTFKLPPGNEKLETQMRAEMLQKMGEIATTYADRIKEGK